MDPELAKKIRSRQGLPDPVQEKQEKKSQKPEESNEDKAKKRADFLERQKKLESFFSKGNQQEIKSTAPKEQIHGNQENFSNARQLLEQKFAKKDGGSDNSSSKSSLPPGTLPPPPPSMLGNLPPPPPPPSLNNLPPPPSLSNLPPPPSLNTVNLPPPPSLNTVNLPSPPSLNTVNLPPPSKSTNPQTNPKYQQKTSNNPSINLPPPPSHSQTSQASHKISHQQNDDPCFIIKNDKNSRPTQKTTNYPPQTQKQYQPPTTHSFQPQTQTTTSTNARETEQKKKKHIFDRQAPKVQEFSSKFFTKNISAYIKREFIRKADIIDVIDGKVTKKLYSFSFPSIETGIRQIELIETLYADINRLDLVSCYMQKNLNALKPHNNARNILVDLLKNYNWDKDENRFKIIIQMVQNVPSIFYKELNFVQIKNALKRCDNLIAASIKLQNFEKCTTMKKLHRILHEMVNEYCQNSEQKQQLYQQIHQVVLQIKNIH